VNGIAEITAGDESVTVKEGGAYFASFLSSSSSEDARGRAALKTFSPAAGR
jgi:hypothetical protein